MHRNLIGIVYPFYKIETYDNSFIRTKNQENKWIICQIDGRVPISYTGQGTVDKSPTDGAPFIDFVVNINVKSSSMQ